MPWETYPNGTQYWKNWTSYIVQNNVTNTTSPMQAINNVVAQALPWYWPLVPFVLYVALMIWFNDTPGRGKMYGIAAIVLVISAFLAWGGYIGDCVINVVIFLVAWVLARMLK